MDVDTSFGGSDQSVQEPTETVEPQTTQTESPGNPFLNEISPEHRAIVAPYLQKWDSQATKKFQEYSGKLKPWEELGSIEDVKKAKLFVDNFRRDPNAVFRLMFQNLQQQYPENFEEKLMEILQIEAEEEMNEYEGQEQQQPGYQEPPDPSEVFQQNVMQELQELRQWREEQEAARTSQEQEKQLDTFLQTMHTKFGEFDDDWVLLRLGEHGDPNRAIQEWNKFLEKVSGNGNPSRQPPKTISSGGQGGGVPNQQINTAELRGEARRKAVMAMLGGE